MFCSQSSHVGYPAAGIPPTGTTDMPPQHIANMRNLTANVLQLPYGCNNSIQAMPAGTVRHGSFRYFRAADAVSRQRKRRKPAPGRQQFRTESKRHDSKFVALKDTAAII